MGQKFYRLFGNGRQVTCHDAGQSPTTGHPGPEEAATPLEGGTDCADAFGSIVQIVPDTRRTTANAPARSETQDSLLPSDAASTAIPPFADRCETSTGIEEPRSPEPLEVDAVVVLSK